MGKVYIIGAGPGSHDLLTIRAINTLAVCDVLIAGAATLTPSLSSFIREHYPRLKIITLDKRHRKDGDELAIRYARLGLNVAHLKNGDPAIFGGLEDEVSKLSSLGISYEVVPGVSSISAACAALGIFPTSKNNDYMGFIIINGHDAPLDAQIKALRLVGRGFILMPRSDYLTELCCEFKCKEVVNVERGKGRTLRLVFVERPTA